MKVCYGHKDTLIQNEETFIGKKCDMSIGLIANTKQNCEGTEVEEKDCE